MSISNDKQSSGSRRSAIVSVVVAALTSGCAIEEVRVYRPVVVEPEPLPAAVLCPPPVEVVYEPVPPPVVAPPVVQATPVAYESPFPVSISVFERSLSPFGEWVVVASFGRVWRPTCVPSGFQPYTVGHWVLTDCGWTFVSDAPWGAVVYHYGRWNLDPRYGWVWVPDTVWAPAWVSWRTCDDFIGWAPLPPGPTVSVSFGFSAFREPIHPRCWSFVRTRDFLAPCASSFVVDARRNTSIIRQTTNITNITVVNQVAHNFGPDTRSIERLTRERLRPKAAGEIRSDGEMRFLGRGETTSNNEKDSSGFSAPRVQSFRQDNAPAVESSSRLADVPAKTRTTETTTGFSSRPIQSFRQDKAPAVESLSRPVDAPEKTRTTETTTGFAGLRGRAFEPPRDKAPNVVEPRAASVPFTGSKRVTSLPSRNSTQVPTATETNGGDRSTSVRVFRNSNSVVAPAPQVEGKRFGSGSAATPRPATPAVPGVVNRPNASGTVVVPFRQRAQQVTPTDPKTPAVITSKGAARRVQSVVPNDTRAWNKEDKNKKS